jgi:hypothetical protein
VDARQRGAAAQSRCPVSSAEGDRIGAEPSLTLANKKAIDIYVAIQPDEFITIDVKGIAGRYDWPASNVRETKRKNHFYVLVSFEGPIQVPSFLPSVWVIPGNKISKLIKKYKSRTNISRVLVKNEGFDYRDAWDQIVSINE